MVIIGRVMAEQLTGLIKLVEGQRVEVNGVIASMPNFGGSTSY